MLQQHKKMAWKRIIVGVIVLIAATAGFIRFALLATFHQLGYHTTFVWFWCLVVAFAVGLGLCAWGCAKWAKGKGYPAASGWLLGLLGVLSPFVLLWAVASREEYSWIVIATLLLLGLAGLVGLAVLFFLPDKSE